MQKITIKKGHNINISGLASREFTNAPTQKFVSISPQDFNYIKPKLLVKEGDQVSLGDALFFDKINPEVKWPSIASGTISKIVYGERRAVLNIIIEVDEEKEKNIEFIDCGTSGGVWGLENGFCLTIGGKKETYSDLSKLFNTLSTPESPNGLYVGVAGAGHYVKMIHNGIEYGMMQSIAEGFEILKKKEEFNLNLYEISQNWRSGSVIQSWLIDLITYELKNDTNLSKFSSMVSDSGEGRWTIKESIDLSVPIPSIYASISQRFNSKNTDSFSGKILSAMRNAFGGHKD